MWSLGCLVAEFYLGAPLFSCQSQYHLLASIEELVGAVPQRLLAEGTRSNRYYTQQNGRFVLRTFEDHVRQLEASNLPKPENESKAFPNPDLLQQTAELTH